MHGQCNKCKVYLPTSLLIFSNVEIKKYSESKNIESIEINLKQCIETGEEKNPKRPFEIPDNLDPKNPEGANLWMFIAV